MGLRFFFLAPFLIISIVSILIQGGNIQGASSSATICNANGCVPPGTTTIITCFNLLTPCKIEPNCPSVVPAPAWCFPWPFNLIPSNQGLWLDAGATVILTSGQVNSALTQQAAFFGFSSIGPGGWNTIILVTAAITVLASVAVLGTGITSEGVRILAMSGVVIGLWGFISSFDGFITGNPNSLFSQLNQFTVNGAQYQFGTILFGLSSLFWVIGWLALLAGNE